MGCRVEHYLSTGESGPDFNINAASIQGFLKPHSILDPGTAVCATSCIVPEFGVDPGSFLTLLNGRARDSLNAGGNGSEEERDEARGELHFDFGGFKEIV